MSNLTRFGVSIGTTLLEAFDQLIEKAGYQSRSEAIRDLVRNCLEVSTGRGPRGWSAGWPTISSPNAASSAAIQAAPPPARH